MAEHFTLTSGIDVRAVPHLRDGTVILATDGDDRDYRAVLYVGTRPLTDTELAGAEARHMVRTGMADVLAWLGQEVGPPPERTSRGQALLQRLRDEETR